jgi:competence protein ComFC
MVESRTADSFTLRGPDMSRLPEFRSLRATVSKKRSRRRDIPAFQLGGERQISYAPAMRPLHSLRGDSTAMRSLKSWVDAGLHFFYPEVCQICDNGRATPADGYVCAQCWSRDGGIRFIKPPFCERCGLPYEGDITTAFECANCREMDLHFRSARSAVVVGGLVLEVIHRYKYQRALWFEPFLADLLARQAEPVLRQEHWDMIVPVPLHSAKKREREYNQAERLATRLSTITRIPGNHRLLKRIEPTRTQTRLTRSQRAANVRNAFAMRNGHQLQGERIVLLDDVLTTGATTSACAKVLSAAGAGEVCVWTVARGL